MSSIHSANEGRQIVAVPSTRPYVLDGEHVDWQAGLTGVVTCVESHGSNPWTRYTIRFADGGFASGLIYGRHFVFTDHTGSCGVCANTSDDLVVTATRMYGSIELCPTCRDKFPKVA